MKWIPANFSVSLVTNGFDMIDNVLTILKRLEDKHALADTSEPNAAYDMIGDLICCVNMIASEMSSMEETQLLEELNERARFERWIKELGLNSSRLASDPTRYDQLKVDLAWDAWRESRTFET